MAFIVAIDPGVRGCGVGIFDQGQLIAARYVVGSSDKLPRLELAAIVARRVAVYADAVDLHLMRERRLCIEVPRSYSAGQQKGDQNDLIDVAMVVGACALAVPLPITSYYPRDWKGTMDPDKMTKRIENRLSKEELSKVERHSENLDHNTFDAIGIGLFALGRLQPIRVIPR